MAKKNIESGKPRYLNTAKLNVNCPQVKGQTLTPRSSPVRIMRRTPTSSARGYGTSPPTSSAHGNGTSPPTSSPRGYGTSPRTSPGLLAGHYAGCKWTEPPLPSTLPLPPQHWMQTSSHSNLLPFHYTPKCEQHDDMASQLKMLLKVQA